VFEGWCVSSIARLAREIRDPAVVIQVVREMAKGISQDPDLHEPCSLENKVEFDTIQLHHTEIIQQLTQVMLTYLEQKTDLE
jgi:hypothetical protein